MPGMHLQDHDLTELAGVLAQKASARLTGDAGALGGADAGEDRRQTGAQQRQSQTAELPQRILMMNFLLIDRFAMSTYFVLIARGRKGLPPSS